MSFQSIVFLKIDLGQIPRNSLACSSIQHFNTTERGKGPVREGLTCNAVEEFCTSLQHIQQFMLHDKVPVLRGSHLELLSKETHQKEVPLKLTLPRCCLQDCRKKTPSSWECTEEGPDNEIDSQGLSFRYTYWRVHNSLCSRNYLYALSHSYSTETCQPLLRQKCLLATSR